MDGRIDGQINKRALALYEGETPKKAKLELLSKEHGDLCRRVTSQLAISSLPTTLPDKARTVSSADSPFCKASHSFDFRFVASDDEVRQLLVAETGDKHRDVTLISHPDGLSQANLVSRLSISADGRHTLRSGKLFEGPKPLTLVIDIRKLTTEELPKFNDLLDPDNPCLYDKVSQSKRPLGEHVALLVVADPAQLASVGRCDDAPGADFWRRINRPGNTWQFDPQTGEDSSMDISEVPPLLAELPCGERVMDDGNTVLVNCHLHSHWRQLLLGGPGVSEQGRIQHIPGRFELLKDGQRVILKGANWQDLAFEQTIRQMLMQKSYESNGKICQLPDDVHFYQMPVGKDELYSLFQSLFHSLPGLSEEKLDKGLSPNKPEAPIIINQSNIREWLSPIAIAAEGYAVPNTGLLEQVRAGGVVTVTSPLTEALWFCLLGSLHRIRETTGLEPRLRVAHTKRQPKALELEETDKYPLFADLHSKEKNSGHAAFSTVTYQQYAQASHWINNHTESPLVIQLNEQTSFSQLFDNIHIASEQKAHFGRRQSELQEALNSGRPVILRGLETNPNLQQLLEPLAVGQSLLVNGQLQAYPEARVTVLWPEFAKSSSPLWRSIIATGEPCPGVDIWGINEVKHDIPRAEMPEKALHQLYDAFKTVPPDLCKPLPELTEGVLNNLIMAARRAQQVDQSPQLLPRHWRKAINSVITHGTRQNPSVRDFMKVACWWLLPDACKKPGARKKPGAHSRRDASVDPDWLSAIIISAPRLDKAFVKQNLWSLVRAFDPSVFKGNVFEALQLSYESPFSWGAEEGSLNRFCAMIVAHAPEKQREAMAYQLEVDPAAAEQQYHRLGIRPSGQIKRLQDALASGWQLPLPTGQTRSDAIHALATDCFHIAKTAHSDAAGIEHIENRLSQSLAWPGSADQPLTALACDLYHGKMSQKDRESRRLSRLHERLVDSPVLFLQGGTGTGKSYFSAKMARVLGQASVISLGPSDSEQTLMKRWQWQEHADGDRFMEQQNRALMEWANTQSDKDEEYITLVLDEANLTQTGLLASLNGLWEPKPCIYVSGHPVKVSSKHRVILTGNPDHYAGRRLDPTLKQKLPGACYPRLDQAFLRDRVVEPALLRQLQRHLPDHQINEIAKSATESVMTLWQYYQELLPEHAFTPRDLTDICSWVGWYLDCALHVNDSVTSEKMNGLIQQSFRDVLGPEISETHQDALTALEIWFAVRYEPDNTLSNKVHNQTTLHLIQQAFKTFTEQTRPDFDTSGSAVSELVQRLGQDLSRCQQADHHNRKHDGRQATLIEGPAGRGKDATLNLVIQSVKQQTEQRGESMPEVSHLNACDCSWDRLCEKIQRAKLQGGIVIISEMNLIDSQHLEGELNDILAGDAHPGFHLFATINPPEYSGRKPLSPALKGRFRHLPIRQYSPAELQTIAEKVLPETPQGKIIAKQLTKQHCRLRAYLQRKKLPLQPTSLDLQNVARAVIRGGDFTEKGLHQCLNQHYRLYLMAAKISFEKLPESLAPAMAVTMSRGEVASGLCRWFNQAVSGIDRPWLIRRSDLNRVDEKCHEICIKADLGEEEAKTEIIKRVARARWQASGLSLKPDQSDDTLTRALYRHWQQSWFDHTFGQTGVDANSVFSLTEEEKQTLETLACQLYLREVDRRIEAWNANEVQLCPALWHQISDLPNHLIADFINEASAISGDDAPEPYNPEIQGEEAPALDQRTNYEDQDTPKVEFKRIFDKQNHSPAMDRWRAMDIYVTPEGAVKQIKLDDQHFQGVEALIPDSLPENVREMALTRDQTLATLEMSSKNGRYPLPSLTPHDSIVALRIKPNLPYKLIRDRYTGLHTLFISGAKADQSIQCAFIVEPGKPGKKTAAKEARPERSILFDVHCSEGMKNVLKELFTNIKRHPSNEMKELLRTINDTKDTRQRINAITEYCKQFSGEAKPEAQENFFRFLVTRQQGSCRHRVPVFIAFCRYFGIPCRQINSKFHRFAEYSADGGQTWESANLGGTPMEATEIKSNFQPPGKVSRSSSETKKIKGVLKSVLKGADPVQQQTLAKACGIALEELSTALETNSALPENSRNISETVENLWKGKGLTGFSMGVSILESLETEALGDRERRLVGLESVKGRIVYAPMSDAVSGILRRSDEDKVTELLKLLHSKMVVQGGACPLQWLSSIVDVLKFRNLDAPSVIHFASEALKSGWLDLVTTYDSRRIAVIERHHDLLLRLEEVDELKVTAAACLKKWYQELFFSEKSSQVWRQTYKNLQRREGDTLFVTDCHDGFSSFLENIITSTSLQPVWTDNPEGVPDIERMLVHQPAFAQLISGKSNHRPVIIMGQPDWGNTVFEEMVNALFQRKVESIPDLKRSVEKSRRYSEILEQRRNDLEAARSSILDRNGRHYNRSDCKYYDQDLSSDEEYQNAKEEYERKELEIRNRYKPILQSLRVPLEDELAEDHLKTKCKRAIQQAFSHYLYEVTHSKNGRLTYCWADAFITGYGNCGNYGAHDPSSPTELYAMMSEIRSPRHFPRTVKDAHLRRAYKAHNALFLKSDELTTIAGEFLDSLNLNSIYDSLDA